MQTTTMATRNAADDATSICSVCLEPYKGRSPKILPCFHTLCLPCLKDLEHQSLALSDTKVSQDDDGDNPSLTFPCPTCRAVITVPPGGVIQFQANFYLNDDTLTCEICDIGNEATYNCSECTKNMCNQCQRFHNLFLPSHHVQPLTFSCQQRCPVSYQPVNKETITQQLAVLEAALVSMKEEEDMLQGERQAVADVITRRADTVRALVTKSEEKSQRKITEKADKLGKEIQHKMTTARQKHAMIVTQVRTDGQPMLLTDDEVEYYQQQCRRGRQVKTLLHQFNDFAIDLQAVEAYIGTVCDDQLVAMETSLPVAADVSSGTMTEMSDDKPATSQTSDITKLTRDISDILEKLAAVDARTQNLESQNKTVLNNVSLLKDEDVKLEQNIAALQRNMDDFTENILNFQKEMAGMRQEFETMKVLNSTLQKDVDIIKQESLSIKMKTKKVKDVANDLSKELKTFKEKSSIVVAFNVRLREEEPVNQQPLYNTLVLSDVICNVGQAYNDKTGIFVAPVTGIYFFMAKAMSIMGSDELHLNIFVKETRDTESLSTDGKVEAGMCCTVHVVKRLTQGQEVSVEAWCVVGSPSTSLRPRETSFSGMLLQQE